MFPILNRNGRRGRQGLIVGLCHLNPCRFFLQKLFWNFASEQTFPAFLKRCPTDCTLLDGHPKNQVIVQIFLSRKSRPDNGIVVFCATQSVFLLQNKAQTTRDSPQQKTLYEFPCTSSRRNLRTYIDRNCIKTTKAGKTRC